MDNKLYLLGIGPGNRELTAPAVMRKIEECDVLIGGKRNLELFNDLDKEKMVISSNLADICAYIVENISKKRIAVLVTGDPGVFSMLEYLKGKLSNIEIDVTPGISSLQYLCSRLKLNWNDACIISLHGREAADWIEVVKKNNKVIIFTGGQYKPEIVCRELIKNFITDVRVSVGQNLSYTNEEIISGSPFDIQGRSFEDLSIMVLEHNRSILSEVSERDYVTPGIPDSRFIRGDVPMTKEEVRTISLSKLKLKKDSIVYDIGAGSGSVSIECALLSPGGKIFAIEKNPEGIELIKKNADKFGTPNITIVHGNAPEVLNGLIEPNRVFIGGTSGSMSDILDYVTKLVKKVRVVINTVTIESTYEAISGLERRGFENIEIVNIAVSRGKAVGGKNLMQALNPIYIISADKGEK